MASTGLAASQDLSSILSQVKGLEEEKTKLMQMLETERERLKEAQAKAEKMSESKRQEMQQARLASMPPVDTTMVTGIGNEAMTKLIGRRMTVQEADMLASYLDQLREERAGYVIGDLAGNADVTQGLGESGLGFDENDVMGKITSLAAPELAGATGFDSAQAIWKGFGMDPIDPAEIRAWRQANAPKWKTNREDY